MARKRQLAWGLFLLLYAAINASTLSPTNSTDVVEEEELEMTAAGELEAETSSTAASGVGGGGPEPVPTWRPKRLNCTPPAIEQFPKPFIGPSGRKHGGLIIHIIICIYSFIGLAIICDDYFVTSLDRICEALRLTPDVAGATFMAAGSSAPELATVVIGVFFAQDDIGVSGVIGSAVFNIMFVIAVCGLCTSTASSLNWWPLSRDCFAYAVSILIMLFVIFDDTITWGESLFMLIAYVCYCVALAYNPVLERWAQTLPLPCNTPEFQANMHREEPAPAGTEDNKLVSYKNLQEKQNYSTMEGGGGEEEWGGTQGGETLANGAADMTADAARAQPEYYKATNTNTHQVSPLIKPDTLDKVILFKWYLMYPIHFAAMKSMPDLKEEKFKNWYPFNFFISMVWISFYSYIMVWMITIIGSTMGIPDTVMGLTFVAAGVSVPDALSSLAVVREGYGDMAVSNAVGSNVFDILICLGLPWFLQTGVIMPGSIVHVYSKGLTYSTLSLLSTVLFLVAATHMNHWKLDRKYGIILMLWYLFFIVFASLYELNVFGPLNPPECGSTF